MEPQGSQEPTKAWLIDLSSPSTRYAIEGDCFRIGRHPESDLVPRGDGLAGVSARHLEIQKRQDGYWLIDLGSTNGTFLGDTKVDEVRLAAGDVIGIGPSGVRYRFERAEDTVGELDETVFFDPQDLNPLPAHQGDEPLVEAAVAKARQARLSGEVGRTGFFLKEALVQAVQSSKKSQRRRYGLLVALLLAVLSAVSFYAYRTHRDLRRQQTDLEHHILRLEEALRSEGDSQRAEALIGELEGYERRLQGLKTHLLYKFGREDAQDSLVLSEIRRLMREFGAEDYQVPPEFVEEVQRYIRFFQERNRRDVELSLGRFQPRLQRVREILVEERLPPDLAYMALVESGFVDRSRSAKGAAGIWQLMPNTARSLGLRVDAEHDERYDIEKATRAAAGHLRDLILEFGSGSSVMLALAAYNSGRTRVRRAIRKVEDPLNQRNFWHLYRARALPGQTRAYIPKIIAAIIIGRNLERFGFNIPA